MKRIWNFFLYSMIIFLQWTSGYSEKIPIGSLFGEDDLRQQALLLSVKATNKLKRVSNDFASIHLLPTAQLITNNTFEISRSACSLLEKGVAAIFGPSKKMLAEHVSDMCETVDVPNLLAHWDIEPIRMKAFNFYPSSRVLSTVLLELVTDFNWKTFTILYDNSESLARVNELLKKWDPKGYTVTIRHLGNGPNYRDVLVAVRVSGEKNIVINCSHDIVEQVLKQSQQVGILTHRHRVIINDLDLHAIDLEPYRWSGVNFTGFRLVDIDDPESQKIFNKFLWKMGLDDFSKLPVEAALIYDSVQFFAKAFKRALQVKKIQSRPLRCDGFDFWDFGTILSNYMRTTEMKGLTGYIKFDTNGFRTDFSLDILKLHRRGLEKIGSYNSETGLEWQHNKSVSQPSFEDDIHNQTFRVLISLTAPYNMLTESSTSKVGNDRYEGYTIDIIKELSNILRFNYTFIEVDPDYGSIGPDGKWTGMIGAIIKGDADLAITDFTITAERKKAVDLTMPFMNLGISILYRKPTPAAPSPFSFLLPLAPNVWVQILISYLVVSLFSCIVGRVSPAEWENPDPCNDKPSELVNQWSLKNSFWFTMGTLMQQGSDLIQIGPSTRGVSISWAFFRLIMVYTYTANLASFLVVETIVRPIKSAEDLANLEGRIKYGVKKNGSTYNFFKTSNYSTYTKMFKYMEEHADEVLVDDNDTGIDKVYYGIEDYAFIMESTSIEYVKERACNLTQIGGLLDAKGYGMAMKQDSKYRKKFNKALLELQENGVLAQLKIKWWEKKRGGGECNVKKASGTATTVNPLSMQHVGGVFAIVAIGILLAAILTLFEFLWELSQTCRINKTPFWEEFVNEMKFIVNFRKNVKPGRVRSQKLHENELQYFVPTSVTTSLN